MAGNRHIQRRNQPLDKDMQENRERSPGPIEGKNRKDGGRAQEFLTDAQDAKSRNTDV